MNGAEGKWFDGMTSGEDWWAVWLGLFVFLLGFLSIWDLDTVGWQAQVGDWSEYGKWIRPAGKDYAKLGWVGSLLVTYVVWTTLAGTGAYFMKLDLKKFVIGFTALFWITWAVWIAGNEAHLAAIAQRCEDQGLSWCLHLGGGASYILALAVGLAIGNFIKPLAAVIREAARPQWFIKIAVVFLGVKVGFEYMDMAGYGFLLVMTGASAAFIAYLFLWPVIYMVARRIFKLPRHWAALLCAGVSASGVSAAMVTGGAIRARPIIIAQVSLVVVIYATVAHQTLPVLLDMAFPEQPMVNGAAIGLTVKAEDASEDASTVLERLILANGVNTDKRWDEGWILSASKMTRTWIDMFVGALAIILALIWIHRTGLTPERRAVGLSETWFRFPKFLLGYLFCWFAYAAVATFWPAAVKPAMAGANIVQGPMSTQFLMLAFVATGCIIKPGELRGLLRMFLFYGVTFIVIVIPSAYMLAWLFLHGMTPPSYAG